jgi:CHAT domain-containing protein
MFWAQAKYTEAAGLYERALGRNATEERLPLADYRVVYFATHGLVAGDIEGLGEPSLALTLPNEPSEFDDGLLTASEVAQLKLNADWVVLSACNTKRRCPRPTSGVVARFVPTCISLI